MEEFREWLTNGGKEPGPPCGAHATASLRRLDDGQNDDTAMLLRRRHEEDDAAAEATGRPVWDSSVWAYTPPALKGLTPVTSEPWARDLEVYNKGLARRSRSSSPVTGSDPPPHAATIEQAMRAYRQEVAAAPGDALFPRPSRSATRAAKNANTGSPLRAMAASPP